MTLILDGKSFAEETQNNLKDKITQTKEKTKKEIYLAVCLVGDNYASQVYVRNKEKAANRVGIKSLTYKLKKDSSQAELHQVIESLNKDSQINGILLQLPLPKHLSPELAILQINPLKDVDGLHPFNLGLITLNRPNLLPCTPYGIIKLLEKYQINLVGKKSLIIGRSFLVGKPISQLLLNKHATVTVTHSKTPHKELIELIQESEIIVSAVGRSCFIKAEYLKKHSIVIDVGINRSQNNKLTGDVDFQAAKEQVRAITPVPGGIGPLTVSYLLVNTLKAFEFQNFGESLIDLNLF